MITAVLLGIFLIAQYTPTFAIDTTGTLEQGLNILRIPKTFRIRNANFLALTGAQGITFCVCLSIPWHKEDLNFHQFKISSRYRADFNWN